MLRLDKLTPEQAARLPAIANEWTRIGLETKPADRPAAEAAIRQMYEVAGFEPPRVVWCSSPLAMALTRAVLASPKFEASVWASVGDGVRDSVWDGVRDSVKASVGAGVRDSVWDSVKASVGDGVWDGVWDGVGDGFGDSVNGQHDAHWLGFYDTFRRFGLIKQTDKMMGLAALAKAAGWALPHEHVCWISERHCVVKQDEDRRIHCENGPAIQYPDGWSVYAIHGVRVPSWLIERPDTITVKTIDDERNAEIRRVMIERMGRDRFVAESGADLLHEDTDQIGFPRLLWKCPMHDKAGDAVFVEVRNSSLEPDGSRKTYFLAVHPELRPLLDDNRLGSPQAMTCHNAVASTFGMRGDEYEPLVET